MRPPSQTHWIRENANERSPHRVLVVDTETVPVAPSDTDHHVLRLWCATLTRRRGIDPRRPRVETFRGTTAAALADLIDGLARSDHALWTFTHNLNFDLAVTELPVLLIERGWRITEAALTTDDPWCRLARGSRRLVIADSWSWLPAGVEAIGELIGVPKVGLPDFAADDGEWWARCERDVEIVVAALGQLMDWWDDGHFGNWSVTGPATGWGSYRHRRPRPRVLVDPDPAARAFESRAVTGGRRGVARVGEQASGLYADLDIATAHLAVMADRLLPARRLQHFDSLATDDRRLSSIVLDVLAECEVETTEPRYPWDSGRGIFYPVGRFRTTLAGPEIRAARERGELRAIGPGYVYLLSGHMRGWALWLASLIAEETHGVPPAVRMLAKHWSRCVPGKWAGRTSDVIRRLPDPRPGWSVERGMLAATRRPADFLRIGGELWTIVRDEWADDSFPAILAWIQSWTRLALNAMVDAIGPAVLSVNTDGGMVDVDAALDHIDPAGRWRDRRPRDRLRRLDVACADLGPVMAPFALRIKGACRRITIISPQHLILDGERRLAGIPRRCQVLAGGRYRFTQWPRLRVQLLRDTGPGYRTVQRTVSLANVPPAGWLLADGRVVPVRIDPGADGGTPTVEPWPEAPDAERLAPLYRQHPVLRRLLPTDDPAADPTGLPAGPGATLTPAAGAPVARGEGSVSSSPNRAEPAPAASPRTVRGQGALWAPGMPQDARSTPRRPRRATRPGAHA